MSEPNKPVPTVNPSPKYRFLLSPDNISKHRHLVDLPEFQRACDFAMLQYETQLMAGVADGNSAAQVGIKLRGVHEFLQTFRFLSEREMVLTTVKPQDNLTEPQKQ